MRRRMVAAVATVAASLLASSAMPQPGAAEETGQPDQLAIDSPDHRAALDALDGARARLADRRAALAGVDAELAEWQLAADHLRDALPGLRARRASAADRLSDGHDELRRLAALRYVMVGSGRLTGNLFSADETLDVLRHQLLLDLAGDARRGDLERLDGTLADTELQIGAAERGLADIEARIAELGAEHDDIDAEIDATAADLPTLTGAVDRTRRAALEAIAVPTTVAEPPPTTADTTTPDTTTPDATTSTERHIDVVGDSLTASARRELSARLGRFGSVSIDAVPGRALIGGQTALERIGGGDPDIVVIALGTNDVVPGAGYDDLVGRSVDAVAGAGCVVWVDVQEFDPGLVEVNRAIHAAPVDAVAPWSDLAGPSYLHLGDGYHLSDAGKDAFSAMIADTLSWACV